MVDPRLTQVTNLPISPNEAINLVFDEELEIQQEKSFKKGKGRIYLGWFPYPNLRFEIEIKYPPISKEMRIKQQESFKQLEKENYNREAKVVSDEDVKEKLNLIDLGDAVLRTSSSELIIDIQRVGTHPNHKPFQNPCEEISGHLEDQQCGDGEGINYFQFYLPNFFNKGFEVELEDWRLTLNTVNNVDALLRDLDREGGYCITHVGKLEQLNGECFSAEEAEKLLFAISYGFSFMRGIRIAPILTSGFNSSNQVIYQKLGSYWVTPWEQDSNFTCMSLLSENDFKVFICNFLRKWKEETWHSPIKLIIQWYVEAIRMEELEGSIALLQIPLETLSWVLVVKTKNYNISKTAFENSPAEQKINHLLRIIGIDNEIPDSLINLKNYAKSFKEPKNQNNGPYVFCKIRNNIVHAAPKNRKKLNDLHTSVIIEARRLGLWYVELALLWILKYQGDYFNRTSSSNRLCAEPVPWKLTEPAA